MKKHDEGYVLAYVTVVLLLFCLIASMILTGAMKNMNNQQDTIARMQDQYVAAGMIEQVVAQGLPAHEKVEEVVKDAEGNIIQSLIVVPSDENTSVIAQSGSVVINCVIDAAGNYIYYEVGTAPIEPSVDGGAQE